jgi:long-subunit fatty acid transport protein
LLGGVEHRFSPNTILVARVGAQFHESEAIGGGDSTSPYVEATVRTQVNDQFSVRGFARYGVEGYDTVRNVGAGLYEFDGRQTFRMGVSGEYSFSPMLSLFSGLDYIPATFDDGRLVGGGPAPASAGGLDEDVVNAYLGVSVKFTEMLYGTLSYNYTDSSSDFAGQSYDRNRVSLGVRAEF